MYIFTWVMEEKKGDETSEQDKTSQDTGSRSTGDLFCRRAALAWSLKLFFFASLTSFLAIDFFKTLRSEPTKDP
jgi:hypothetical protein